MSSQLPNIVGKLLIDNDRFSGCVYEIHSVQGFPNNTGDARQGGIDASRCSKIYKDGVTQVFGDSVAMNAFIKAKLV